jgi:predicted O-methyltransferase YrrM
LDYYREHGISPVAQDIGDLQRHFERRSSLYHSLGIVPSFLRGKAVIEFGPGSGFNSIYTASLQPSRYVLVDGNPTGAEQTAKRLHEYGANPKSFEVVHSLIEEYDSSERFDLSICEGTIPFQLDPDGFARKVGSFCKPGGVVVITTASSASVMGETTRRLIANRLMRGCDTIEDKLSRLRPVFAPHLATIKNMSRPVDDWILDNLIHPWIGKTFGIDAAINSLSDTFDIYGASPDFIQDWRWYKDIWGPTKDVNGRAIRSYLSNMANFLDYRVELPPHSAEVGSAIAILCDKIYSLMLADGAGDNNALAEAGDLTRELARMVQRISPVTAESLHQAAEYARDPNTGSDGPSSFTSFFGRGSQYLSFIMRQT